MKIKLREMIETVCEDGDKCDICTRRNSCDLYTAACLLYSAGYRKANEVRKETAKEILQELYDITFEMKDPYNGDVNEQKEVIDRVEILHTAKMYGVGIIDE